MSTAALVSVCVALLLYAQVLISLGRQWMTDPAASHGLLVAGAAMFVLSRRWTALRSAPAEPRTFGIAILVVAMVIYLAGTLAGDLFVLRLSLPLALVGGVLALFGTRQLRIAAAPIVLLALSIPLPAVVVTSATLPLQLVSSQIAADMLQVSNINVVRQGNLLVLDHITLEVAEACSGLQSVISLFSVAAVCAAVLPINRWGRVMMFAAVLPIAIIGNGVRVAATGVLTTWIGELAVRGVIHDATGYVAFLGMCAAIFALLRFGRFSVPATTAPATQPV